MVDSNRGSRTKVYVTIGAVKYGFAASSKTTTAHGAALGHKVPGANDIVFYGINSPKPARASKEIGLVTVSSFIDPKKEASAKADGWTIITKSRRRGIGESAKTLSVGVDMPGGVTYAYRMSKEDFNGSLGRDLIPAKLVPGTPNVIWGANSPKPPVASKIINGQRHSTFINAKQSAINNAIAQGYSVSGIDYALVPEQA